MSSALRRAHFGLWPAIVFAGIGCSGCPATSSPAQADAAAGDAEVGPSDAAIEVTPDVSGVDRSPDAIGDAVWSIIPGGEPCGLRSGDVSKAALPPLVWDKCGEGCTFSDPLLAGFVGIRETSVRGEERDGDLYVSMENGRPGEAITRILRLSDGRTVGLVQQRSNFADCGVGAVSPFRLIAVQSKSALHLPARVTPEAVPPIRWATGWVSIPGLQTSVFAAGDGLGFVLYAGAIRWLANDDATGTSVVDTFSGVVDRSAARGTFAVWPLVEGGVPAIRGMYAGEAVQTFANPPLEVVGVALAATSMVWTAAKPKSSGGYEYVEIQASPLPKSPKDVVVARGPALPSYAGVSRPATAGDFVAALGLALSTDLSPTLFVVQVSTKKLWSIHSRPGNTFTDVYAMSGTEILIGERTDAILKRLLRLRLDRLDELVAAW